MHVQRAIVAGSLTNSDAVPETRPGRLSPFCLRGSGRIAISATKFHSIGSDCFYLL
jgi:hypothetical protein